MGWSFFLSVYEYKCVWILPLKIDMVLSFQMYKNSPMWRPFPLGRRRRSSNPPSSWSNIIIIIIRIVRRIASLTFLGPFFNFARVSSCWNLLTRFPKTSPWKKSGQALFLKLLERDSPKLVVTWWQENSHTLEHFHHLQNHSHVCSFYSLD